MARFTICDTEKEWRVIATQEDICWLASLLSCFPLVKKGATKVSEAALENQLTTKIESLHLTERITFIEEIRFSGHNRTDNDKFMENLVVSAEYNLLIQLIQPTAFNEKLAFSIFPCVSLYNAIYSLFFCEAACISLPDLAFDPTSKSIGKIILAAAEGKRPAQSIDPKVGKTLVHIHTRDISQLSNGQHDLGYHGLVYSLLPLSKLRLFRSIKQTYLNYHDIWGHRIPNLRCLFTIVDFALPPSKAKSLRKNENNFFKYLLDFLNLIIGDIRYRDRFFGDVAGDFKYCRIKKSFLLFLVYIAADLLRNEGPLIQAEGIDDTRITAFESSGEQSYFTGRCLLNSYHLDLLAYMQGTMKSLEQKDLDSKESIQRVCLEQEHITFVVTESHNTSVSAFDVLAHTQTMFSRQKKVKNNQPRLESQFIH